MSPAKNNNDGSPPATGKANASSLHSIAVEKEALCSFNVPAVVLTKRSELQTVSKNTIGPSGTLKEMPAAGGYGRARRSISVPSGSRDAGIDNEYLISYGLTSKNGGCQAR